MAKAAEDAGVTLVLELLNSKVDHPDYQCDRTDWGVNVCESVNSPRVKLLYDIYHMQIMEGDLIRTIQTHHAWFGHYHMAGNPGRHEPETARRSTTRRSTARSGRPATTDSSGWNSFRGASRSRHCARLDSA